MTTPPADDVPPTPSASSAPPAPGAPAAGSAESEPHAPDPGERPHPDPVVTPRPPQAWFSPPDDPVREGSAPHPPSPAAGLAERLDVVLIGAAVLLVLSAFLPWTSWSLIDPDRQVILGLGTQRHIVYGIDGNDGLVVVLAGMAALGLAVAARAVDRRFAVFAAIPGALGLVAVFHRGVTLGNTGVPESVSWGYWVAVLGAVAVLALALVLLARDRPQGRAEK